MYNSEVTGKYNNETTSYTDLPDDAATVHKKEQFGICSLMVQGCIVIIERTQFGSRIK